MIPLTKLQRIYWLDELKLSFFVWKKEDWRVEKSASKSRADEVAKTANLKENEEQILIEKIPHQNRSQVQVSLKVTAQIRHLNITVMLDFLKIFDIFSIDQSPEIAGKLNNHVLNYK